MSKGRQKCTFSITHISTHILWYISSLKLTFPSLRLKASRKFPFQIHISRSSHSVVLYYIGDNIARVPGEDVSSDILQGCNYTLCFILVSHCANILFAAATWLLKHFKHHSKVTALKCKTLFSYILIKHLLMKTRVQQRGHYYPK